MHIACIYEDGPSIKEMKIESKKMCRSKKFNKFKI